MEMDKEQVWVSNLYGCTFPGSPCHTWTETNGNTPCSLIMVIFQDASHDKSCRYVQIIVIIIICSKNMKL